MSGRILQYCYSIEHRAGVLEKLKEELKRSGNLHLEYALEVEYQTIVRCSTK